MGKSPPGRPRSSESDRMILEATLRLIASEGYARMSMDRIASEAGVSKPTIYLRYDSKEDLVTAALAYLRIEQAPGINNDVRSDLIEQMRHFRHTFDELSGMSMLGTVLMEERRTPKLLKLWRERTSTPYRRLLKEILEHAREQEEIRVNEDLDTIVDVLLGAYHARYLSGEPFPSNWPEPLVDFVLRSLTVPGEGGS